MDTVLSDCTFLQHNKIFIPDSINAGALSLEHICDTDNGNDYGWTAWTKTNTKSNNLRFILRVFIKIYYKTIKIILKYQTNRFTQIKSFFFFVHNFICFALVNSLKQDRSFLHILADK